jgi:hypothetical protein
MKLKATGSLLTTSDLTYNFLTFTGTFSRFQDVSDVLLSS